MDVKEGIGTTCGIMKRLKRITGEGKKIRPLLLDSELADEEFEQYFTACYFALLIARRSHVFVNLSTCEWQ